MKRLLLSALVTLAAFPLRAQGQSPADSRVDRAEKFVSLGQGEILQVETLYAKEMAQSEEDAALHRFADAEIQFLLGEYRNASVLLYDLVGQQVFRSTRKVGDAYYYLAESLYQKGDYVGSRRYFRELLELKEGKYVDQAVKRYLQIASRLGDYSDTEQYFNLAQAQTAGGVQRPELSYTLAKFNFKRTDLDKAERLRRAKDQFQALLAGPYGQQSNYFLAVIAVEQGDLAAAAQGFADVVKATESQADLSELRELANLSLGRVLYEQGKYGQAIDRYQEISRNTGFYADALFEIAWAYVKMGQFEKAERTDELLLILAQGTALEPEARLLEAHLALKLAKYGDAHDAYDGIIHSYAPVRDDIDRLLTTHGDPIVYFDQLVAGKNGSLDIDALLPGAARKWATTQSDVGNALEVIGDLEGGKKDINESRELGNRLLATLAVTRSVNTSPLLAEGAAKAEAADTSALTAERLLLEAESSLVTLDAAAQAEVTQVRHERGELEARFAELPRNGEAVDARKVRMQKSIDPLDSAVYRLGYQVDSLDAQIRAIKRWLADSRANRQNDPEGEKMFAAELEETQKQAEDARTEYTALKDELATQKAAIASGGGDGSEDVLRQRYDDLLAREREILARARGGQGGPVFSRIDRTRASVDELRRRVAVSRKQILATADERARQLKEQVTAEMRLLDGYEQDANGISGSAENLVGRIAYESFRRVRHSFYNLVLKADVGLVDVAWTKKRDKTDAIQKLAGEKDRDLRSLDAEFRDVLEDTP